MTLYEAAMRNFQAAADILEALQSTRLDLVGEARSGLIGRPRLALSGGYNDVTPTFGACLPTNGRAELLIADSGTGVELRCTGIDWLTLEGTLAEPVPAELCYIEMQVTSDRPQIADVFLREFIEDGSVRDSGHLECHLDLDAVSVCKLPLPEIEDDVTSRRVIIHLRQPAARLILDRLAITLT
ncbi:hypothetical protein ACEUZ9_003178 [Paracoccus litorisediminis]|uniref:Uncharacterized protein n=1 Tax=Paracoccus litorisediminis TaxID=2006130 RepID=A0A844HQ04_9RHOB|nr:hypothetical protein [Paracoccus litorisediminis]MTH60427.1 hypothetical protein [Paracoccus litorisediminis]